MAQKRMFDKRITDSDKFMDLPNSSKALYFMAGMAADDRGFFQPRKLQKLCGFTDDDYKVLIAKGYLIPFESGVMVITDWNKNNYLDKNRITETEYIDELNLLKLINEKYQLESSCLTDVKPTFNQYSIEENSIEENSIYNINIKGKEKKSNTKTKKEVYGTYGRVKLTSDEYLRLVNEFGEDFINNQINLLDEYIESNNNKNKYTNFNLVLRRSIRENWFNKNNNKGGSNNVFLDIMKEEYGG